MSIFYCIITNTVLLLGILKGGLAPPPQLSFTNCGIRILLESLRNQFQEKKTLNAYFCITILRDVFINGSVWCVSVIVCGVLVCGVLV